MIIQIAGKIQLDCGESYRAEEGKGPVYHLRVSHFPIFMGKYNLTSITLATKMRLTWLSKKSSWMAREEITHIMFYHVYLTFVKM